MAVDVERGAEREHGRDRERGEEEACARPSAGARTAYAATTISTRDPEVRACARCRSRGSGAQTTRAPSRRAPISRVGTTRFSRSPSKNGRVGDRGSVKPGARVRDERRREDRGEPVAGGDRRERPSTIRGRASADEREARAASARASTSVSVSAISVEIVSWSATSTPSRHASPRPSSSPRT